MKRITRGAVFAKKLSTLLSKAVRCWPIARQAGCAPPERTAPRLVRSASRRAERPHLRHRRVLHHPQWTLQAQLLTTRSYLGCVTGPDGLIYTIGGVLGDPDEVVLGAVEAYSVSGGRQHLSEPDIILLDSNTNPVPIGAAPFNPSSESPLMA